MCEDMRRTVVYRGDKISISLTRCWECTDCYNIKLEIETYGHIQDLCQLKVTIGDPKK